MPSREHKARSEKVHEKIARCQEAGPGGLYAIADFDRTLTWAKLPGIRSHTTFGLIEDSPGMDEEFRKLAQKLYDCYHGYEFMKDFPEDQKKEKMDRWWQKVTDAHIKFGLSEDILARVIESNLPRARQNAFEILEMLWVYRIPVLIFSGGQGNLIERYLKHHGQFRENLHLVSNFIKFGATGKADAYKLPLIHTLNKTEVLGNDAYYREMVSTRKAGILLGDHLKDAELPRDSGENEVLKIGFFNKSLDDFESPAEYQENLHDYEETYDVLIRDDGPMDYVYSTLQKILDHQLPPDGDRVLEG